MGAGLVAGRFVADLIEPVWQQIKQHLFQLNLAQFNLNVVDIYLYLRVYQWFVLGN